MKTLLNIIRLGVTRFSDDRRGVSSIEFGLSVPVMLIGLIMAVDLGYGILMQQELTGAARTASQYALVLKPAESELATIETAALDALGDSTSGNGFDYKSGATASVSLECLCSGGSTGSCSAACPDGEIREAYLTVDVTQSWTPFIQYPVTDWPKRLTGSAVIRLQ